MTATSWWLVLPSPRRTYHMLGSIWLLAMTSSGMSVGIAHRLLKRLDVALDLRPLVVLEEEEAGDDVRIIHVDQHRHRSLHEPQVLEVLGREGAPDQVQEEDDVRTLDLEQLQSTLPDAARRQRRELLVAVVPLLCDPVVVLHPSVSIHCLLPRD